MKRIARLKKVKLGLLFFITALFISGLTAIPIDAELRSLLKLVSSDTGLHFWFSKVLSAYEITKQQYPFLLYGYDWLAFAHFVLAILFIGPYRKPLKNIWVIEFGLIACVLVVPFAFVAGSLRGIPFGWILIDCSFGVFGFILLGYCYRQLTKFFSSVSKAKLLKPQNS
jgi:hypothetical protein